MNWSILPFIILPLAIVAQISCFRRFDRLIRHWHDRYHGHWLTEGEPMGFFFVPDEVSTRRSYSARSAHFTNWLFTRPEWVSRDEESFELFRKFRVASTWSIVLLVAFFLSLAGIAAGILG